MKTYKSVLTVLFLVIAQTASAALLALDETFSSSVDYAGQGVGRTDQVSAGFFTGTFSPFDTDLGTLESITVDWAILLSATNLVAGPAGCQFGFGTFGAGGYEFDGTVYSGNGTGGGAAGGANEPFSLTPATVNNITTWTVAEAPQYVLDAVLGSSDFDIFWDSGVYTEVTSGSLASGEFNITGDVTLTYNYEAVPEPASALLLMLGAGFSLGINRLRRNAMRR